MSFTVYVVAKEVQQPHGTSYLLYYKNYKKKRWVRKTEEKSWTPDISKASVYTSKCGPAQIKSMYKRDKKNLVDCIIMEFEAQPKK